MSEPMADLEALQTLTTPEEVEAVAGLLQRLEKDTEILLFVGEGCAVCPHQIRSVATVTLASERISLEIVEVSEDPELAMRHEIRAVPTTVVDDELVMVGVVPAQELAWRLVERQGPEAEQMIFAALVAADHHADAAERMADGRGTQPFLELWERGGMQDRMGLFMVADQALLYEPGCLDALVPRLLAGLEPGGPLAADEARRGDTVDLLGQIGDPTARPVLERLTGDPDEDVAEAAREALDALDGAEPR